MFPFRPTNLQNQKVRKRTEGLTVVLPLSMWAEMPMLRSRSDGVAGAALARERRIVVEEAPPPVSWRGGSFGVGALTEKIDEF